MKRSRLLIGLLLTLALGACVKGRVAVLVAEMQQQCPLDMGQMTLDSVGYDNNTVKIYYTSDLFDIKAMQENAAAIRGDMLQRYASNSEESFAMLRDALVAAEANLKVTCHNRRGEAYEIAFTADELKNTKPDGESNS